MPVVFVLLVSAIAAMIIPVIVRPIALSLVFWWCVSRDAAIAFITSIAMVVVARMIPNLIC